MTYDYATIEARMKSLPDDVQQAMVSADVENAIYDIAENRGLDIEQAGMLADITSYVMLGLLPSKDFVNELSKQASIPREEADQIGIDINKGIFDKIRESLRKVEETRVGGKTPVENPQPTAAPVPMSPATSTAVIEPVPFVDHLLAGPTSTAPAIKSTTLALPDIPMPAVTPIAKPSAPIPPNLPIGTDTATNIVAAVPKPAAAAPTIPKPPEQTRPPYSVDPYREPLE